jgi:hypothetical protein
LSGESGSLSDGTINPSECFPARRTHPRDTAKQVREPHSREPMFHLIYGYAAGSFTGRPMTNPAGYPLRYQIVVQGEFRVILTGLIGQIEDQSSRMGNTHLVVTFRDESEFWGLMDQFQDLGLHLVSLHELGSQDAPSSLSAEAW